MAIAGKVAGKGVMFIIHRVVFLLNFVAIFLLLASYTTPYISPNIIWYLSLLGISYPVLLLLNILFIIYWLIFFRFIKMLYSIIAISIGFAHVEKVFKLNAKTTTKAENTIKVMSFNGNYFGVYLKIINSSSFFEYIKKLIGV